MSTLLADGFVSFFLFLFEFLKVLSEKEIGPHGLHILVKSAGPLLNVRNAQGLVARLERGHGLIPSLFIDTTMVYQVAMSLANIKYAAGETAVMMEDLKDVIGNMKRGDGTAGMLLTDTLLRNSLHKSIANIEQGLF